MCYCSGGSMKRAVEAIAPPQPTDAGRPTLLTAVVPPKPVDADENGRCIGRHNLMLKLQQLAIRIQRDIISTLQMIK